MIENKKHCTMILLAGGSGRRMGTDTPKQFLEIKGKPVLLYSLLAIQESEIIDDCILVIRPEDENYIKELLRKNEITKVASFAYAGGERYESVWNGLQKTECTSADYVYIHDGARPFVNETIIRNCYDGVEKHGACVAAVRAKDTVKIVATDGEIINTPDRSAVWNMQTPQTFRTDLICEAYRLVMSKKDMVITDDAQALEIAGLGRAYVVEGSYENIKVTTPEDLLIAEIFAN